MTLAPKMPCSFASALTRSIVDCRSLNAFCRFGSLGSELDLLI
jgi:hypothetical protein